MKALCGNDGFPFKLAVVRGGEPADPRGNRPNPIAAAFLAALSPTLGASRGRRHVAAPSPAEQEWGLQRNASRQSGLGVGGA